MFYKYLPDIFKVDNKLTQQIQQIQQQKLQQSMFYQARSYSPQIIKNDKNDNVEQLKITRMQDTPLNEITMLPIPNITTVKSIMYQEDDLVFQRDDNMVHTSAILKIGDGNIVHKSTRVSNLP